MSLPIPEPRDAGTTRTTALPLAWVRYGDPTNPTLVLLHGGPGADHRYLLPQMLHLAEQYELVLYDQRGSGKSRAENNAPITWQDHVADLAQLCRELDIDAPSIVGYSWGGMLALLYTITSLDDVTLPPPSRLALISPAPITTEYRAQFDAELRARGNAPVIVAEREALAASGLRERDPDTYRQRLFELGVAGYFANPTQARELTPFRVVGRVQQSTWESLGDFDLRPALARIGQQRKTHALPIQIVQGRDDPIPAASSIDAARALGCDVVFLDDCGHVPYVERPAGLWGALDPFLASTNVLAEHRHD